MNTTLPHAFPARAGVGLKPEHYSAVRQSDADGLWLDRKSVV